MWWQFLETMIKSSQNLLLFLLSWEDKALKSLSLKVLQLLGKLCGSNLLLFLRFLHWIKQLIWYSILSLGVAKSRCLKEIRIRPSYMVFPSMLSWSPLSMLQVIPEHEKDFMHLNKYPPLASLLRLELAESYFEPL